MLRKPNLENSLTKPRRRALLIFSCLRSFLHSEPQLDAICFLGVCKNCIPILCTNFDPNLITLGQPLQGFPHFVRLLSIPQMELGVFTYKLQILSFSSKFLSRPLEITC